MGHKNEGVKLCAARESQLPNPFPPQPEFNPRANPNVNSSPFECDLLSSRRFTALIGGVSNVIEPKQARS